MKLKIAIPILLIAVTVLAQSLTSPKLVSAGTLFMWDNPDNPPEVTAGFAVYASVTGNTNPVRRLTTTNLFTSFGNVLNSNAAFGKYTMWVRCLTKDGVEGDPSTNYFVYYWAGKGKPPKNLR
jgi:hypothetical protein